MSVAQDLPIGIVVDRDELGTPADRHRKTARQDQPDAQLQVGRPRFARTERRVGPIRCKGEGPHFIRAGRAIGGLESEAAEPSWGDAIHLTPRQFQNTKKRMRRGFVPFLRATGAWAGGEQGLLWRKRAD